MASIMQKFDLSLVDPSYMLELKQTLTVKPKGLRIRAALRTDAVSLSASPSSAPLQNRGMKGMRPAASGSHNSGIEFRGTPLYVLYGSNTGTSEAFAQRISNEAPSYGMHSAALGPLS